MDKNIGHASFTETGQHRDQASFERHQSHAFFIKIHKG